MAQKTIKKICSECGIKETNTISIVTILLPPTIITKKDVCEPCLSRIIDNDIHKNKSKLEDVKR